MRHAGSRQMTIRSERSRSPSHLYAQDVPLDTPLYTYLYSGSTRCLCTSCFYHYAVLLPCAMTSIPKKWFKEQMYEDGISNTEALERCIQEAVLLTPGLHALWLQLMTWPPPGNPQKQVPCVCSQPHSSTASHKQKSRKHEAACVVTNREGVAKECRNDALEHTHRQPRRGKFARALGQDGAAGGAEAVKLIGMTHTQHNQNVSPPCSTPRQLRGCQWPIAPWLRTHHASQAYVKSRAGSLIQGP